MSRAAARSMARIFPGSESAEFDGFYVRSHPLPTETLNEVHVTKRPEDPDRILQEALRYFESRSPQWRLICRSEWASLISAACRRSGLEPGHDSPEMILLPDHASAVPQVGDCRRVESLADLRVFQRTFSLANQLPETSFWVAKPLLVAPEWDLFVGFLDGKPVATGVAFTSDSVSGVWAIATIPESRGRGIGTAVTSAVIHAGRSKGAIAAHLWATEMGFPVYHKMGFRHIQNKSTWIHETHG